MVIDTLRDQWARIGKLDEEINAMAQHLNVWRKQEQAYRRNAEIAIIGPLIAIALVAAVGDARNVKIGRELAACLGLVPR